MVWRADEESVAAGGGIVGVECGAGCGGCGGAGGVCDWERDAGVDCVAEHAMRRDGAAADVWARAAHGRDDAELDVRQAGADGAWCGGHDAGAGGDQRAGWEAMLASVPAAVELTTRAKSVTGLRVGYFREWMKEAPATDVDRHGAGDGEAAGDDGGAGDAAGLGRMTR